MSDKWIKIACDFCDDEKIKIIRNHEGGDTFIWIWLWLLTTAMKKETDTLFVVGETPYDAAMISLQADVKLDAVIKAIELFTRLQMIKITDTGGIHLVKWHKHQSMNAMLEKREQARIRKENERERKRIEIDNACCDVTRDMRDSHAIEKSKSRVRQEKDKDIPAAPDQSDLDPSLAYWYQLNTENGLPFYKTTKADKADLKAMLDKMGLDAVKSLMSAWFAARAAPGQGKFFVARITSFCSGYSRIPKGEEKYNGGEWTL